MADTKTWLDDDGQPVTFKGEPLVLHNPLTETDTPSPGVYRGVPMEDYHGWDAASHSRLRHLAKSPAHCWAATQEQFRETEALRFGRAAHTAILEAHEFDKRYVASTQCVALKVKGGQCSRDGAVSIQDGRTVCVQHRDYYEDPKDGREVLSAADFQRCIEMSAAVHTIPTAHELVNGLVDIEYSVRWNDDETGIPCKGRFDGVAAFARGCLFDLKTTLDARPEEFAKSIFRFGYHTQGAMYLEAAKALGIDAKHYVILAQEKERPYGARLYRLEEGAIAAGSDQIRTWMRTYAECLESGGWPGYPENVTDITLPDFAWKQLS